MEVVYTCPLGSECETAKKDESTGKMKLYRCRWYVKMRGKDPQSDNEIDEFRCSMEWMPLLQVEHSLFDRQTGAAVESLRNNVIDTMSQQQARMERIVKDQSELPASGDKPSIGNDDK